MVGALLPPYLRLTAAVCLFAFKPAFPNAFALDPWTVALGSLVKRLKAAPAAEVVFASSAIAASRFFCAAVLGVAAAFRQLGAAFWLLGLMRGAGALGGGFQLSSCALVPTFDFVDVFAGAFLAGFFLWPGGIAGIFVLLASVFD